MHVLSTPTASEKTSKYLWTDLMAPTVSDCTTTACTTWGNTRNDAFNGSQEWRVTQIHLRALSSVHSEKILKLAAHVSREKLVSVGTCFGKFTKTMKFRLHITALDFLAPYAKVSLVTSVHHYSAPPRGPVRQHKRSSGEPYFALKSMTML